MDIKSKEFWTQNIEEITGEQIMMNTPECLFYKTDNKSCKSCSYELNCAKLSSILIVQHHLHNYQSKDFTDFMQAGLTAADMIEGVLAAKTIEGIEKIIRGEKE